MTRKPASPTTELVFRCQNQERNAQSEFYQKYKNDVARAVYKVFGPDPELEDVIQDVFIEAFRSIEKFRGSAKVTTWLYRVAYNVSLQRLRKRKRRKENSLPDRDSLPDLETPQKLLERQETLRKMYEVLDRLSPKKRVVFVYHEFMGMDAGEIARMIGTNVLTVRTRLHYARKEFYRQMLESDLFSGAEAGVTP